MHDLFRSVDWTAIAALAGVAAAVTAISAVIIESRRHRFSRSVELLLRFEERFEAETMRRARRAAANGLKAGRSDDVDDVLDFFETVGLLVQRGALDAEMVWSSFEYWIRFYTHIADSYIRKTRQEDGATWLNLIELRDTVLRIDARESGGEVRQLSPEEIEEFLEYEANQ